MYSRDVGLAYSFASKYHAGMKDKAGADYILHPMRVAERMELIEEKVVALLHDVVEDTKATLDDIRALFGDETAKSVEAITHLEGESWSNYLIRVKSDPVALKVKLADLVDNANLSRFKTVTERDVLRAEKYIRAMRFLMELDD